MLAQMPREEGFSESSFINNNSPQVGISSRITIAALCVLMLLVVEFAATLLAIFISQILEGNFYLSFYPDVDDTLTDPRYKKNENGQSELPTIQGWDFTFAVILAL
ncbi:mfs transporter [Trichoderma arundinaceum]|uniref:Mfs transporter n=1 Tax=Trichoderma arundinaceum TaxID=490622 RepID=A0A395NKN4_TRIAR|nr:mfs transporter [Trichoderma arundinaceum]